MGVAYGWTALTTFGVALGLRLVLPQEKEAEIDDRLATVFQPVGAQTAESAAIDPNHYLDLDPVERVVGLSGWAARASLADLVIWLEGKPACSALEWRMLLIRWAELDVEGFQGDALALIEENEPFGEAVVGDVLLELARQRVRERPRESIAELETDDPLLYTAYEAWLRQDRAGALEAIEALPDESQRLALLQTAAQVWASQDPEQALEWALGKGEKTELVEAVLAELISKDPDKAWAVLKEHGQRVMMETKDEMNDIALDSVITLFDRAIGRDTAEALDWLAGVGDDNVRTRMVEGSAGLSYQLLEGNLSEWLERLPFGKAREQLAIHMAFLKYDSLGERLKAVESLEGVDHDRLVGKMLSWIAFESSDVSATVSIWQELPDEARSSIVRNTSGLEFLKRPDKGVAWLEGLPSGVAQPEHYSNLWNKWARLDSMEASYNVEQLSVGPLRDGAIQGLVEGMATGRNVVFPDYVPAWRYAQTMSSSTDREKLISEIEDAWRQLNPEALEAFLNDER